MLTDKSVSLSCFKVTKSEDRVSMCSCSSMSLESKLVVIYFARSSANDRSMARMDFSWFIGVIFTTTFVPGNDITPAIHASPTTDG